MKIVFFNGEEVTDEHLAIQKLKKAGHEVFLYSLDKIPSNRRKLIEIRHFQMYEHILDYAQEVNADVLYFACPISCPELMIYELRARPDFKPKITFMGQLRELNRSMARSLCLKELVDLPQISRVTFSTLIQEDIKLPDNLIKVGGLNKEKTNYISEYYNVNPELFDSVTRKEARDYFGIKDNEFVLLNSGSWSYIKGTDIFIEAIKHINKDITIFIHKNTSGRIGEDPNFLNSQKLFESTIKTYKNIISIERRSTHEEMVMLYKCSDLVLCSHRRLYEYSVSGVPGMAALAEVPIVAPDFYYFNELIDRYKIGVKYIPEDPLDMARAINYAKENIDEINRKAKYKESIKNYYDPYDAPFKVIPNI
jgi:glycosyltransferase involved in cell wall biosynthesis